MFCRPGFTFKVNLFRMGVDRFKELAHTSGNEHALAFGDFVAFKIKGLSYYTRGGKSYRV